MPAPATFSKSISGFDPRSVSGCQLWLDAADSSSVTGTTTVTAWRDKSNNSRNLSVGSGTTSYANNAITLASSYMLFTGAVDLTNFTFFIVAKSNGAIYNQTVFGARPNTSAVYNSTDGFGFYMDNQNSIRLYGTLASGATLVSFSATTSVAIVYSFQSDSTIINGFRNGTSVTGASGLGARTSTAQGFALGGEWNGTTYINIISTASINEIIVYNTNLSTSQRQAIEGYLAWKWGIQTVPSRSLITTHPFYNNRPFSRYFNPIDIPECLFWWDAADTSTITRSGTQVTSWRNKGSWNGSAVSRVGVVTSGTATFNGLNIVQFPIGTELGFTVAIPNQARAWFAVFKQTRQVTVSGPDFRQYFAIINQTQGSGQDSAFGPGIPTNTGTSSYVMAEGPSGNPNGVQTGNLVPNGFNVMKQYGWINSAISTASNFQTVNGTDYLTAGTPAANNIATAYRTDSVTYTINTNWYNNSCDLAEILFYNSEISTSQRQQIEGYLAWKWGLNPSLPATNPYKQFPPSSALPFSPTSISGCELWLDGADPLGTGVTPANGTGVSTWFDKSGFGNSAIAFTSINAVTPTNPTVATNSLNGLPGVLFSGTSGMRCPAFVTSPSAAVFMVVNFTGSSIQSFLVWKLKYSSYFAIAPGQVYVGVNSSGAYPGPGYDARATYTNSFGTPFVLGMTLNASSAASSAYTFVGSVNGTATTTTGTSTSGNPTGCTDFVGIGVQIEGGIAYYPMSGIIYEVLVYDVGILPSQRIAIEGYLAWKWGLQNSLPTTHPYRNFQSATSSITITATGGTITTTSSIKYHTFTSSGSFVVTAGIIIVNYLIVGGGGGGGDRHGGGGGAGGVVGGTFTTAIGTYTITVGNGGAGGNYETNNSSPRGSGIKGGDSSISSVATANGGGGGGTYDGNPTGTVGSGGGGGGNGFAGIAGTLGQGNAGGSGLQPGAGGGGGAGGAGVAANTGTGGIGTTAYSTQLLAVGYGSTFAVATSPNTVISGGIAYIAGGGGGAAGGSPGPGGTGGLGGGGRGDWDNSFISVGTANSGGGGGGSRSLNEPSNGRDGGSGLVLIWYGT